MLQNMYPAMGGVGRKSCQLSYNARCDLEWKKTPNPRLHIFSGVGWHQMNGQFRFHYPDLGNDSKALSILIVPCRILCSFRFKHVTNMLQFSLSCVLFSAMPPVSNFWSWRHCPIFLLNRNLQLRICFPETSIYL